MSGTINPVPGENPLYSVFGIRPEAMMLMSLHLNLNIKQLLNLSNIVASIMLATCLVILFTNSAVAADTGPAKLDHHIPNVVTTNANDNAVYVTRLKLSALSGHGSGVLISSSGLVLTNWHVVLPFLAERQYKIKVDWLPWAPGLGNSVASIIYVAPDIDLALLKIEKSPGKNGVAFADSPGQHDRIYPVGFSSGSAEGAIRKPWEYVTGHNDLSRTIDTGEITNTVTYSYSDTWNRPPKGAKNEDWQTFITKAQQFVDSAHKRPALKSDPDSWQAIGTNAWVTGGQSGGPCFGEDGKLIALNHGSAWESGSFQGSMMIPVDLLKLFLVGIQDTGDIQRAIITSFDNIGGAKNAGLPYASDGHPFAKRNGEGVIQGFRLEGHDSGIAFADGAKKAYWIHGAIWARWASRGGPSYVGYPVSEEYDVAEGRRQDFQQGSLTWFKASNTVFLTPKVTPPKAAPDGLLTTVYGYTAPSGSTLVPVRSLAEWCGAKVSYDAKTKTIYCDSFQANISLTIGSKAAQVESRDENRTVSLTQPATEIDGYTLVPLRFVAEAFGCNVEYKRYVEMDESGEKVYPFPIVKIQREELFASIPVYTLPPADMRGLRGSDLSEDDVDSLVWPTDVYGGYALVGSAS